MIYDRTPLNLNEVDKILENIPDSDRKEEVKIYLKKFLKVKTGQAEKIKIGLEEMDLLKLKREHIVKIADLMPEDASDLNKIFSDVSLNEDENNKILELVKNSK
jgi:DNA-directed RNA polymerase subunit F|tara:strand:- start:547 stop:858 length:312 start_codon:yes stop_codon:yes gene_type:complete